MQAWGAHARQGSNITQVSTVKIEHDLQVAVSGVTKALRLPGLSLSTRQASHSEAVDLWLDAKLDGREFAFALTCELRPTARDVALARERAGDALPALAAVHLPKPLVERCLEQGVSCLDLNGRLHLRAPGLLVDREPRGKRFRTTEPERDLFAGKGGRLARVFLSFPGRTWKQGELVELTGCSAGLVSRLVREYARLGWMEGGRGDWTLAKPDALLDAWAAADRWERRVTVRQYSGLERDPERLAREFLAQHGGEDGPLAFTQWFAATHRRPYAELPVVSVYRPRFLSPVEMGVRGLREVDNGGRLWVLVPRDEGVFQAGQTVDGLPLVCDAQMYLDLLPVGLRGPDAARALREWEGFCRR